MKKLIITKGIHSKGGRRLGLQCVHTPQSHLLGNISTKSILLPVSVEQDQSAGDQNS